MTDVLKARLASTIALRDKEFERLDNEITRLRGALEGIIARSYSNEIDIEMLRQLAKDALELP